MVALPCVLGIENDTQQEGGDFFKKKRPRVDA
jgi:hypothetical protein